MADGNMREGGGGLPPTRAVLLHRILCSRRRSRRPQQRRASPGLLLPFLAAAAALDLQPHVSPHARRLMLSLRAITVAAGEQEARRQDKAPEGMHRVIYFRSLVQVKFPAFMPCFSSSAAVAVVVVVVAAAAADARVLRDASD